MLKQTQARDDIEAELLDLRDHPLPFFDEKGPPMSTPSENAEALRWQETLARYDGFVFVVAEYNSSITGVLKNALDQAYKESGRKPFTAVGYGGAGAARAIEHLRQITSARRMVSTAATVKHWRRRFHVDLPDGCKRAHRRHRGKPACRHEAGFG
jgi:NAD(P)H-dependent FMN reductase